MFRGLGTSRIMVAPVARLIQVFIDLKNIIIKKLLNNSSKGGKDTNLIPNLGYVLPDFFRFPRIFCHIEHTGSWHPFPNPFVVLIPQRLNHKKFKGKGVKAKEIGINKGKRNLQGGLQDLRLRRECTRGAVGSLGDQAAWGELRCRR